MGEDGEGEDRGGPSRAWRTWQVAAVAAAALLLGIGVGRIVGPAGTTAGARPATTLPAAGAAVPAPADFRLTVRITDRRCAGRTCEVAYAIEPTYVGVRPLDPASEWELTYELRGGDDERVGTIETQGDQYFRDSGVVVTGPDPQLEATVTSVRAG